MLTARTAAGQPDKPGFVPGPRYKWIALSNTTIGVLMVTINSSIVLIAMPDIFRGIKLNPLTPSNTPYFLWMMMGFMVATAVLVVSFGRVGDMYGRVRMYNLGFAVFTFFSIMLAVTWLTGPPAALWLVVMRILQGVGGALLFANSSAILTDVFPEDQRGLALGINQVAAIAGSFIGLVLGGVLGPQSWRLVFLVSVPVGLFGTVWAYVKLRDTGYRNASKIDWWGNVTFGVGLVVLLIGITYGILPHGQHTMGWTGPVVLTELIGGAALLVVFAWIETKVAHPMFRLPLFRIRAFTAGNFAALLSALARGGLMFILIIWLQGIWLPRHGYSFASTPLWAGIYMLPMTVGFLIAGPISGWLSDRFGARPFATGGMIVSAAVFVAFQFLPANFSYIWFGLLLLVYGLASGVFSSPNRAGIMNSLPASQRGAGAGMSATFQNSAMVLSIGIFFTLIIVGLATSLPHALYTGLTTQGLPHADALRISHLPPVSNLFAAFLGYNPMKTLLGPALAHLPAAHAAFLTGRSFFPSLIAPPFIKGLHVAFDFAIVACILSAIASWMRGGKFIYNDAEDGDFPGAVADGQLAASTAPAVASSAVASSAGGTQNGNGKAVTVPAGSDGAPYHSSTGSVPLLLQGVTVVERLVDAVACRVGGGGVECDVSVGLREGGYVEPGVIGTGRSGFGDVGRGPGCAAVEAGLEGHRGDGWVGGVLVVGGDGDCLLTAGRRVVSGVDALPLTSRTSVGECLVRGLVLQVRHDVAYEPLRALSATKPLV